MRRSKAHDINPKYSVTQAGHTLVQWSCPSGCVTGYFWGPDDEAIRRQTRAIIQQHIWDNLPPESKETNP